MRRTTSTRISLLKRVKDPDDAAAWREFHALYAPLLFRYARARALALDADALSKQGAHIDTVEQAHLKTFRQCVQRER